MIGAAAFDPDVTSLLINCENRFIELMDPEEHVRIHIAIYKFLCDTE
jgi:hypothetical protein